MSGTKIISALKEAAEGNFKRVTTGGKTWVVLEVGEVIVREGDVDTAHAVGFREGFRAACGGAVPPEHPPARAHR